MEVPQGTERWRAVEIETRKQIKKDKKKSKENQITYEPQGIPTGDEAGKEGGVKTHLCTARLPGGRRGGGAAARGEGRSPNPRRHVVGGGGTLRAPTPTHARCTRHSTPTSGEG